MVQEVAKDIAEIMQVKLDGIRWSRMHDHMNTLLEIWMHYEHYEVWKQVQSEKQFREQEEATNVNLMAEDMADLRKQLMELSDMEEEEERG